VPVGTDPQVPLTQRLELRRLLDAVGIEVLKLKPVLDG
jgi:hypothetical protein